MEVGRGREDRNRLQATQRPAAQDVLGNHALAQPEEAGVGAGTAEEGREREFLAYGEKFFANDYDTEATLTSITREDLLHLQYCAQQAGCSSPAVRRI